MDSGTGQVRVQVTALPLGSVRLASRSRLQCAASLCWKGCDRFRERKAQCRLWAGWLPPLGRKPLWRKPRRRWRGAPPASWGTAPSHGNSSRRREQTWRAAPDGVAPQIVTLCREGPPLTLQTRTRAPGRWSACWTQGHRPARPREQQPGLLPRYHSGAHSPPVAQTFSRRVLLIPSARPKSPGTSASRFCKKSQLNITPWFTDANSKMVKAVGN